MRFENVRFAQSPVFGVIVVFAIQNSRKAEISYFTIKTGKSRFGSLGFYTQACNGERGQVVRLEQAGLAGQK